VVNDVSIQGIETLVASARTLVATDAIKQRVTERAIAKKAPYHRDKNSVGDAIIIETYAKLAATTRKGVQFAFVAHYTRDFSEPSGDRRDPHGDLATLFNPPASTY
jgi:hypothetical protein